MNRTGIFSGTWNESQEINVPISIFNEGEHVIVHCPAWDISGYGNTEDEAKDSFVIVMTEVFKESIYKGSFVEFNTINFTIHV
jgi:hypothetical protein